MPVQADGQAATVEQHRQNRRRIAVLRVFEIGEKMRPHLPAVAPAFDVRRGERCTQIFRHLPNQGLPILPRRLVVGFDLRNRLRLVFFQLGKLVKRDVEQFAVFRRQHDACSFCGELKRPISDCRHRLAAALHISGNLSPDSHLRGNGGTALLYPVSVLRREGRLKTTFRRPLPILPAVPPNPCVSK